MITVTSARLRFLAYHEVNGLRPTDERWTTWLARELATTPPPAEPCCPGYGVMGRCCVATLASRGMSP